ncbi:RDD family protein [Vibrio hyugaensis]|uniref:RDD family protein n=1 Tax=Vibrio hyugaensis TaxID=1534743 RepID=UPI0005EEA9D4|nr:RDD family protein [Vibrio hyugaensis]
MWCSIASKKRRFIGGLIDFMIVTGIVLLIALTINSLINGFELSLHENLQLVNETKANYVLTIPMLMLVNWNLLREGQTIGMRLVGIKVVMKNGHDTTKVVASLRLCISYLIEMLIPFTPLMNITLFFFHPKRRLLHDMLSGTKVVNC